MPKGSRAGARTLQRQWRPNQSDVGEEHDGRSVSTPEYPLGMKGCQFSPEQPGADDEDGMARS
jgi:hypothetical protein